MKLKYIWSGKDRSQQAAHLVLSVKEGQVKERPEAGGEFGWQARESGRKGSASVFHLTKFFMNEIKNYKKKKDSTFLSLKLMNVGSC